MLEDDTKFDRLVDGELTTDEYREMLTTLDEEPGGWRRCAMAFLEAQAWTLEIRHEREQTEVIRTSPGERESVELPTRPVVAEQSMTVNKSSPISVVRSVKRREGGHSWLTDLVRIAAIIMFSLGLGMWIQDFRKGQPATAPFIAGTGPAVKSPAAPALVPRTIHPVGKPVTLVLDDRHEKRSIDLPLTVVNSPMKWMSQPRTAMPPEMIQQLRRMGHKVQRQGKFVPVRLHDGRQIIVPMEEFEIVPVGDPGYQ